MFGPVSRLVILSAALGGVASLPSPAAADHWNWGVSYGVSLPVGNTADFTDEVSWRNVGVEGRRVLPERNMSVGIAAAWNVFFEEGLRTSQVPGTTATVHGYQYRYTNAFPIYLNGHYYFGKPYGARPFVGLNLGTIIIEERIEVGLIAASETNWHFGGAPEVGVAIPHGDSIFFLNARFNVAASAGSIPNQSYLTFSVGIAGS